MRYDFDSVVSREGWGASKWEAMRTTDGLHPLGIVPFSIADMEFRVAPEIQETLKKTVEMGVLGYTEPTEEYYDAVMRWMERRHNWRIEQEWIQPTMAWWWRCLWLCGPDQAGRRSHHSAAGIPPLPPRH